MIGPRTSRRTRDAFTLVEMLVTVTIVAILASMVFAAMTAAENTAKIAKTQATIAKLHRLIMARYESYKTRRIPIDMSIRAESNTAIGRRLSPKQMARIRLDAIREIMRMEMPERASDIINRPDGNNIAAFSDAEGAWAMISTNSQYRKVQPTSLYEAYYDYYLQQVRAGNRWPTGQPNDGQSAECLYLIITMACPGGREQFSENEIGDVDHDGWPEFIDGWGRPIQFFRWAPGFIPANNADTELQSGDPVRQHDPFDTQGLEPTAYQLIPLIYSNGPDGINDILASDTYDRDVLRSGRRSPYATANGKPASVRNSNHFDNIHNHRLDIR